MQLVTFVIDRDKNLIIQFPVFMQPYTQQLLILYQLETVSVPIIDQNPQAHSYTQLQIEKPYIALNSETYISIRQQELRACKRNGYEFYCDELFIVKHKSKYSCESGIYFNLNTETIKENYNFKFYYNETDIPPMVLDGGNEIILANWPNDKHILCNINNDIPVRIPSHPYILINRSVLCNCGIKADSHYLPESLAACDNINSRLIMYFRTNTAFANYLDMFPNLTESLEVPIIKNRTTFKQILPVSLNISKFDNTLLTASTDLKEFVSSYSRNKEIFDSQQRYDANAKINTNKKFFSDNYIVDIFVFISAIILLLATTLTMYLSCKHKKLRVLIASLVLQQVKEVGAETRHTNSECRALTYIGIILTILSLVLVSFLHCRKSKFCKGHRFSNAVKIMIFISNVQNYIPIKLCKTAGSIHLFKITGLLKRSWKEVTVTFNCNKIDLPSIFIIKLQHKFKVR